MSGKKLLIFSFGIFLLLSIPTVMYFFQQQPVISTPEEKPTTLSFSPSTAQKSVNDTATFGIQLDPGSHRVSFISLDITYDPTKMTPMGANALTINKSALPIVLQGPVYSKGRIRINLSTGNDSTAAISEITKIGDIAMKMVDGTQGNTTSLSFGPSTEVLAVTGTSNESAAVESTTSPSLITIAGRTTAAVIVSPSPEATQQITQSPSPAIQEVAGAMTTPTPTITFPSPTSTPTQVPTTSPTPTNVPTVAASTPTPTPTLIPTKIQSVLDASTSALDTPTPTLEPAGPGLVFMGVGAILMLFIVGGALLLFVL